MRLRHAIVLVGWLGFASAAGAQNFQIDDVGSARNADIAQLKPGTVAFSDHAGAAAADGTPDLIRFADWASQRPIQKKFLALYQSYVEPTITRPASDAAGPWNGKLYMYIAQARFALDRAPGTVDLSRYVNVAFLERIDPAIKHTVISAADVAPFSADNSIGNDDPDRKWCTGYATSICIRSTYKLEGKIPIGVLLVNKLRDSVRKISDHIEFESELSALAPADVDQPAVQQLTALDTPISGVLEQDIFHVNELMRFGKFFAVFQSHPTDPGKTVVTAFMAIAVGADLLDKKREYENVPVLHNLVPAQVLTGQSSFNSGDSISAGLPKYARNEISTIAGILAQDKASK
jgi:hypothetical protein